MQKFTGRAATLSWSDASLPPAAGNLGSALTIAGPAVQPLDERIPVTLGFADEAGAASARANLREDRLRLTFRFANAATGDASCGAATTVQVPLGPYIHGVTQSMPSAGTVPWAVPGPAGANPMNSVIVPGREMVDVFATVSDSDYAGMRAVRLYYFGDTARSHGTAPPLATTARYDADPSADGLAPYERIDLVPVAGNQWRTPPGGGIPAADDTNVWYFLVAVDGHANFDREPEAGDGAFQYYQLPFDPCANVPAAPALSGVSGPGGVTLSWEGPRRNTDGTIYADPGGYTVYRTPWGGVPVAVATLPAAAASYADSPADLAAETYTYTVTASDDCAEPGPNEGPPSNGFTECEGSAGCELHLVKSQQSPESFQPGDSFAIELQASATARRTSASAGSMTSRPA